MSGHQPRWVAGDPSGAQEQPASAPSESRRCANVWVLRHGESTANQAGLIVSAPTQQALVEVGLTERGRDQARLAAEGARRDLGWADATGIVFTSDFARAAQTARIFAEQLGWSDVRIDTRLRERNFGTFDGGPATAYEQVWEADEARATPPGRVETVRSVAERVSAVCKRAAELAESAGVGEATPVVLVAHGDVLQIALALSLGMDPHDHRRVPHLANAELRPLGNS